jgi:hypothetical protein
MGDSGLGAPEGVLVTSPQREHCTAIVERWSAAPTHDWSPAIGTALTAGYRWLDVYCDGCRQVKPVDLAAVDIHPQACLTSLILMLRCRQCGGHGPLPKLVGLSRFPPRTVATEIERQQCGLVCILPSRPSVLRRTRQANRRTGA